MDAMAVPAIGKAQVVPSMKFHQLIGHQNEEVTKKTAEYYGVKLSGDMEACEPCLLAKARQKNLGKVVKEKRAVEPGGRLFFDISSVKRVSFGGSKFWLLIVDDATDFCFSYFSSKKVILLKGLLV